MFSLYMIQYIICVLLAIISNRISAESMRNANFDLLGQEGSFLRDSSESIKRKSNAQKVSEITNKRIKSLNEQTGRRFRPPEDRNGALFLFLSPTPSTSPTPSVTASTSPSSSPTASISLTPSSTIFASPSSSESPELLPSKSENHFTQISPSSSADVGLPSSSGYPTQNPSESISMRPSASPFPSGSSSLGSSYQPTISSSPNIDAPTSPSPISIVSPSVSSSHMILISPTASTSWTANPLFSRTPDPSSTPSLTLSMSPSGTESASPIPTTSPSQSMSQSQTMSPTPISSVSSSPTPDPSSTPSPTLSTSPSATGSASPVPTTSPSPSMSQSATPSTSPLYCKVRSEQTMAGHRQTCDCVEGYSSYQQCFRFSQTIEIRVGLGIDPTCLETCMNNVAESVCSCEDPEKLPRDIASDCCSQCDGKMDFIIGDLCGTKSQEGYRSLCLDVYEAGYFTWYDGSTLALSCRYQHAERPSGGGCNNFQSLWNTDMGIGYGIDRQCMEDCLVSKIQEPDAANCAGFVENERIHSFLMYTWHLQTHSECCAVCGGVIYGSDALVCALHDPSKAEYDLDWWRN